MTVGAGGRAGALPLLRMRSVLEVLGVLEVRGVLVVGVGVAVSADGKRNPSFPQLSGPGEEELAGLCGDGLAVSGLTCPAVVDPLRRPASAGAAADPGVKPVTVPPVGVAGAATE